MFLRDTYLEPYNNLITVIIYYFIIFKLLPTPYLFLDFKNFRYIMYLPDLVHLLLHTLLGLDETYN
jgi:hypothetical protein